MDQPLGPFKSSEFVSLLLQFLEFILPDDEEHVGDVVVLGASDFGSLEGLFASTLFYFAPYLMEILEICGILKDCIE